MSDDDDAASILEWNMLDDPRWRLRPGFRFQHSMTYEELCQYVNMEARKVGADPFRAKKRRMVEVEGGAVPRSVTFYCNHGRSHKDQVGRKEVKTPAAKRSSRASEQRRLLYSECTCSFVVIPDPGVFVGASVDSDQEEEDDSDEEAEGGPPTSSLSQKKKVKWLIPEAPIAPGLQLRRGRTCKAVWGHTGHPKRCVKCGDITDDMHPDIFAASRNNVPMSSLQAVLLQKYDVFISMSQLRYAIDNLNLGVFEGRITKIRNSVTGNQSENLVSWILEQDDTDCCLLVEDVDRSTPSNICFETWLRKKENPDFELARTDFDGGSVLKPKEHKPGKEEEIHNDRVYDSNRFIKLGKKRVFMIGVVWTHDYEVRIFSAYPDLLVFDGKMNTNKMRQEHFCGVGVDGGWRNSVLFRAWLPNKTDDACQWLWLHAVPLLIAAQILRCIFGVMADDCSTMGPILKRLVCISTGILPNAKSYLCIYHFERNFFSKFGVGSSVRQYNLTGSQPTKYCGGNWGGKVDWAYPWQRVLVGAIYRLQQCESKQQFLETIAWVSSIINKAPNMGPQKGKLRNAVRAFFEMKLETQTQWVKFHRLHVRILDTNGSGRGEGEFSHLWQLGLTSGMTYRTAITKMKFGSDRRRVRKIVNAETWIGTRQKRRATPLYSATLEEWHCLSDKFTPHYSKAIEKEIALASTLLTAQLVGHDTERHCAIWRVWSKRYTEEEASASDDDSIRSEDDLDVDAISAPQTFGGDEGELPNFPHFPSSHNATGTAPQVDDESITMETFQWRYVRAVTAKLENGKYEFKCTCAKLERTCIVCRHIFAVLWLIFQGWCLCGQSRGLCLLARFVCVRA